MCCEYCKNIEGILVLWFLLGYFAAFLLGVFWYLQICSVFLVVLVFAKLLRVFANLAAKKISRYKLALS